jgi:hypothetical protein
LNNKDNIVKLKDINAMSLSTEDTAAIEAIASEFQTGEATKQEAFDHLLNFCIRKLQPFTEERKSGLKLVNGSLKKLGKLMEGTVLDTLGLTSTYVQPARQLAKAAIEGGPEHLQYVIDNLTETGDSEAGDLPGPIFAPSRLIVSLKNLRLDDDKSLFEVDPDNGLMLKDRSGNLHRFGSLSIESIKDILRTGTTDPEVLDLINRLVGEFTEEGQREKPGALGLAIKNLREIAGKGEEPDQFALEVCDSLENVQHEVRDASVRRNREVRAQREAELDMQRQAKRLASQQKLGTMRADGENILASVGQSNGNEDDEANEV